MQLSRLPNALSGAAFSYLQEAKTTIATAAKDAATICRDLYAGARSLASAAWSRMGLPDALVRDNMAAYRQMSPTITEAPEAPGASDSAPPAAKHRKTEGVGALLQQLTTRILRSASGPERAEGPDLRAAAQAALKDPQLKDLTTNSMVYVTDLQPVITRHFDAFASEAFWKHPVARMNGDNFGSLLSLSVLDRIQTSGEITQKDLHDMRRALEPFKQEVDAYAGSVREAPILGDDLLGPLDDAKMARLADAAYGQYVAQDAPFAINGSDRTPALDQQFQQGSVSQKLGLLNRVVTTALKHQEVSPSNVTKPLEAIPASLTPAT